MSINKSTVVQILEEIGTLLELKGENPFKSRAYYNAARTIETMSGDVIEMIKSGEISNVKGIGKALSEKLSVLVSQGHLPYHDDLKASVPSGLLDMLTIPGMGAKKVKAVYDKLGITTIGELEYACLENRLRELPGFGQKSQQKILQGIELRKKYQGRYHYPVAYQTSKHLLAYLKNHNQIQHIEVAGSLRRKKETVKDIDLIASCRPSFRAELMDYFTDYDHVEHISGKGETKTSVLLDSGIQCDLRLVDDRQFPFALHHFTGSKEHNTAMRQRAKSMQLTMNEYGLFPEGKDKTLQCDNETDIFQALKLMFIPPELRENYGEIEASEQKQLPQLVSENDLKGLFHVHSNFSDGAESIKALANACQNMGFQYLGICDHSKAAFYANGLDERRIQQQHEEIDRLNEQSQSFTVLKGIECDILPDGRLDFDDETLASFDFVIVSVHSSFGMSEQAMTKRICDAIRNPLVTMLGHPSGRLLLGREAYALDQHEVLETAAQSQTIVEINANPHRLDLDWRWGKTANKLGVKTAINPDAHSIDGLYDYQFGLNIARKGWFTAESVINTYSLERLLAEVLKRS